MFFKKNKLALVWVIFWVLLNILTFLFWDPSFHLENIFQNPNLLSPFGTDAFGRNLFFLIPFASFKSLFFSFFIVFLSSFFGTFTGLLLSTLSAKLQFILHKFVEFVLAFPSILIVLLIASLLPTGWSTLAIALLISYIPSFVRLAYVRSKEILLDDFILSAQALGGTKLHLATKHIFPSLRSFILIKATDIFSSVLLAEVSLTFIGVGAPLGNDTWGSLLLQGKSYLVEAPYIALFSGLPLFLTVYAIQSLVEKHKN